MAFGKRYALTDEHPALTPRARGLGDDFDTQQIVAELVLGLHDADLITGDNADRVIYAIALQMNFQLEQGIDPMIMSSVSSERGSMTKAFHDRVVNPKARMILAPLLAGESAVWPSLTSVRGPQT